MKAFYHVFRCSCLSEVNPREFLFFPWGFQDFPRDMRLRPKGNVLSPMETLSGLEGIQHIPPGIWFCAKARIQDLRGVLQIPRAKVYIRRYRLHILRDMVKSLREMLHTLWGIQNIRWRIPLFLREDMYILRSQMILLWDMTGLPRKNCTHLWGFVEVFQDSLYILRGFGQVHVRLQV